MNSAWKFSREEVDAIYELGRMYYEMGYFAAAERIFAGLVVVDRGQSPARLALGLLKLERGLKEEAAAHFRSVLDTPASALEQEARLALAAAFISSRDFVRARTFLLQTQEKQLAGNEGLQKLHRALLACTEP
jgi:hypothetical protein